MFFEIRKELYEELINVLTAYSCEVYFVEAPADQTLPYVVFSHVTGGVRWDTIYKDDDIYIQVNGYGKDLTVLSQMQEAIRARLDNNPTCLGSDGLLDDGSFVYDITEQINRTAKLGDVWQFTLQFKITIQKS